MSLERCPNEILFIVASYLRPADMSSLLQANRRLANLLTPDFAKILSARTYPNRDKRLRRRCKSKRRTTVVRARRQRVTCVGSWDWVKGRGRGRGACGSVSRSGEGGEPSMSSSSAIPPPDDENKAPPTVVSGSRPVIGGVYSGVNKPLPKARCRTRYQALPIKLTRGSPEM